MDVAGAAADVEDVGGENDLDEFFFFDGCWCLGRLDIGCW